MNIKRPGLRKQIAAYEKQAKDEQFKAKEASDSKIEANQNFKKECQNLGIEGHDLDSEILNLVIEIPKLFKEIQTKISSPKIVQFIEFYHEFCKHILDDPKNETKRLVYLNYLHKYGDNITDLVKERLSEKTSISPELIQRDTQKYQIYNDFAKSCEKSLSPDFIVVENNDIQLDKGVPLTTDVILQEETLLSDHNLRDLLLNDFAESEAFTKRRIIELKGSEQATFNTYGQTGKAEILQTCDSIEFLSEIQQIIQETTEILTSKHLFMLLNLKHNPAQTKEKLKLKLSRHLQWADKYEKEQKYHELKEQEIRTEMQKCKEKLEKELKYVEELKSEAQKNIAEVFKCDIDIA